MAGALQRLPSGAVVHRHGSGPPLPLLHGVGGGAWSWAPQVQALAAGFECRACWRWWVRRWRRWCALASATGPCRARCRAGCFRHAFVDAAALKAAWAV